MYGEALVFMSIRNSIILIVSALWWLSAYYYELEKVAKKWYRDKLQKLGIIYFEEISTMIDWPEIEYRDIYS